MSIDYTRGMSEPEMKEVAKLFASMFIARPDIKAIQRHSGEYNPVETPFSMKDLLAHISGELTYGHYLLNQDNMCKLFVFDIDLDKPDVDQKTGEVIRECYVPTDVDADGNWCNFKPGNPREIWLDRTKILERNFFKFQLRMLANKLARGIHETLGLQVAATYTGSKGVHVYGFTGLMPAEQVRVGAELVLESLGCFGQAKGNNFFKHLYGGSISDDMAYRDITVELFPKQTTLSGKTHGNLCRLPLGRNLKNPKDPTFFLDFRGNYGEKSLMQRDPVDALNAKDYWA